MFRVLFLLCLSLVFFACSSPSGSPDSPGGGNDNSSDSNGENGSSSSGNGNTNNGHFGANITLPGNADKSAIRAKYDNYMESYYVSFQEDPCITNPDLTKTGTENSARIKWKQSASDNGCKTVSEGIGYGMLLAALVDGFDDGFDKNRFDKLLEYHKLYRISETGLMNWQVNHFTGTYSAGAATDADIDVLGALIIAYRKTGNEYYKNEAIVIGKSIWDDELSEGEGKLLLPTRKATGLGDGTKINISYISLAVIKALAEIDTERDWNFALDKNIEYMQMVQNAGNGLWPDWSNPAGEPIDPGNGSCDNVLYVGPSGDLTTKSCFVYNKESVRIPWRIAWYYHWFGDSRAKEMLDKAFDFVNNVTGGSSNNVKAWYGYNDDKIGKNTGGITSWASLCTTGLGSPENSTWNTACNDRLLSRQLMNDNYYFDSLTMLYLMLFNGGFDI